MFISRYLPGDRKNKLSEIVRVNHSGELGAINIYKGQITATKHMTFVRGKQAELIQILNEMYQQEIPHLAYFNSLIEQEKIRPSIFTPLWSKLGFGIGYITAVIGASAAMTLTVGVEEVISTHYKEQLDNLDQNLNKALYENIATFMAEEVEHMHIGIENDAEKMCGYFYFNSLIKCLTKAVIYIAKIL